MSYASVMVYVAADATPEPLVRLGASLAEVNAASILISLMVAGSGLAITLIAIGLSWQQERNIISAELAPEVSPNVPGHSSVAGCVARVAGV